MRYRPAGHAPRSPEAATERGPALSLSEGQTGVIPSFPCHFSGRIGYVAPRLYPEDAKQYFGMTETYDITKIDSVLPSLIGSSKNLFTYTTADASLHKAVTSSLSTLSDLTVK